MKTTEIKKEALEPVVTSRAKAVELATLAEQAMKDARLAELEYKVQIQQMYLENGLEATCRVDINTGAVTWPEAIEAEAAASSESAPDEEAAEAPTKSKRGAKKKTAKKVEQPQVEKKSA